MKRMLVLAAVLAVSLFAFPVMAREAVDTESGYPEGLYIGAGGDYSFLLGSDVRRYWESGGGPNLKLGYSFGRFHMEGDWFTSSHKGKNIDTGRAADIDFTGYNLNFRESFLTPSYPNQIYVLAGLGYYMIESKNVASESTGWGFNLGMGLEHYFTQRLALNVGVIYRFIEYTKAKNDGVKTDLNPALDGDSLSVQGGLNFYF
jgi:hypothetical protein